MGNNIENNKRIAKNTIILYIRMFILIIINLYTSRAVLKALGVEDYGVYDVVCGVVTMFSLLTSSLALSISRFLTFELGNGNKNLNRVLSASKAVQIILIIIVLLFSETIGLWFVNNKLVLPEGRIVAANIIFQLSIVTFCLNLLIVPYNALVIAYERMNAFSYISVLEALLKFTIALIIGLVILDKLIVYGALMATVPLIILISYYVYCQKTIEACKLNSISDAKLVEIKKLAGFAGWSLLGSSCYLLNTQGVNILTNLFWGVRVNAARGITAQADTVIRHFVTNFTTALNPQITKNYASGNTDYMYVLVSKGAKYSCYLFLLIVVPLLFETDFLLNLWLAEVPEYVPIFLRLSIICALFDTMGTPLYTTVLAVGKIKKYFLVTSSFTALGLPVTYVLYSLGGGVIVPYIVMTVIYFVILWVKLFLLYRLVKFPVLFYLKEIFNKCILTLPLIAFVPYLVFSFLDGGILRLLLICLSSTLSLLAVLYVFGLDDTEKYYIKEKMNCIIKK